MCYPDVPCHGVEPGGHRRGEDLQQPRARVEGGRAGHGDDEDLLMNLHTYDPHDLCDAHDPYNPHDPMIHMIFVVLLSL